MAKKINKPQFIKLVAQAKKKFWEQHPKANEYFDVCGEKDDTCIAVNYACSSDPWVGKVDCFYNNSISSQGCKTYEAAYEFCKGEKFTYVSIDGTYYRLYK